MKVKMTAYGKHLVERGIKYGSTTIEEVINQWQQEVFNRGVQSLLEGRL